MKIQKQKQKKPEANSKCVKSDQKAHLYLLSLSPHIQTKRENVQKSRKQIKAYVLRQSHDFKDHGLHMWPGSSFELRRIYQWKNVKYLAKNLYEKSYLPEQH
jgi:hypothetical protein